MKRSEEAASERYLTAATRGLWGRRRREIREELEAHLCERVLAHRIGGMTEAVELALAELGSPQEVNAGMIQLYTLPTVVGSGALALAAASLSVALLTASAAPALPGTFYWPSPECVQALEATSARQPSQCFAIHGTFWVNQHSLQQALEPQGVIFKKLFADNTYSAFSVIFPRAEARFRVTQRP